MIKITHQVSFIEKRHGSAVILYKPQQRGDLFFILTLIKILWAYDHMWAHVVFLL